MARMPDEDEHDSPFAHVPVPGAGPSPLQEGPFTYEKLVTSAGRGFLRGLSFGCKVIGVLTVGVIAFAFVIALLGALSR